MLKPTCYDGFCFHCFSPPCISSDTEVRPPEVCDTLVKSSNKVCHRFRNTVLVCSSCSFCNVHPHLWLVIMCLHYISSPFWLLFLEFILANAPNAPVIDFFMKSFYGPRLTAIYPAMFNAELIPMASKNCAAFHCGTTELEVDRRTHRVLSQRLWLYTHAPSHTSTLSGGSSLHLGM